MIFPEGKRKTKEYCVKKYQTAIMKKNMKKIIDFS